MSARGVFIARLPVAAVVVAVFCVGGLAQGDPPQFMMTWDASGDPLAPETYNPASYGTVQQNGGGTWRYVGDLSSQWWTVDWDVTVDPDPFVDAVISVTNTTNSTQTFSLLMTLPTIPVLPTTLMNGSSSLTVTNNDLLGGSALLAPESNSSVYKAFIDLVDPMTDIPVATLFDAPYELEAIGALATASDTQDFGDPVPIPGPGVNTNIAILLEFTLSPMDSATVTGIFNVVPGPGGLSLLAVFGLAAGRRRRR